MACSGRYAEAWEYAAFWCKAQLLIGAHEGAGPGDAALEDTTVNFINAGAQANSGQILYNTTQSTNGPITAVTETTMTATGVTWDNGDAYQSAFLTTAERARIEHYLNITAGDIYAALGSVGACDCSFSSWGANFLAELNIILARLFYDCPCAPDLSDAEKRLYSELVESRLSLILSGEIDVCSGETGSNYPVFGSAERSWTEFSAAEIIVKDIERNRS